MPTRRILVAFSLAAGLLASCEQRADEGRIRAEPAAVAVAPSPQGPVAAPITLVDWHGPVEHLFIHPLVLDPVLAFRQDRLGQGFADYFVTVRELRGIVEGLWRNDWTLVDAHRVVNGTVRVPAGRKPLLLSEDDANYYRYFAGRGLASRLMLDSDGSVRAEVAGRVSHDDLVPIVDEAVARHPELSADGAKGVLALTGYEGLLGEREVARDPVARARAKAVADRLRATGWSFASHTYGHLTLAAASASMIAADAARWRALADDVLGPVDLMTYPFGSRPSAAGVAALRDAGFPIQFDIDVHPRVTRIHGATVLSRRHVDGLSFAHPERLAPFFAVAEVTDPARPRGTSEGRR